MIKEYNEFNKDISSYQSDRVICVDTGGVPTLTKGKVYDGKIFTNGYVGVTDDTNDYRNFKSKRFMLLSEHRLNKLGEVGI
jgi:hypothetical protein